MLQVKRFNEFFINEDLEQSGRVEKPGVVLNYDEEFLEIVNKISISHQVGSSAARALLSINNKELASNIESIGIGDSVETLKMTTSTKTGQRNTFSRIGRMLNKLIGLSGQKIHPKDVEAFVNIYKANYNYKHRENNFKEVSGQELVDYYLSISYDREEGVGQLGKSCMNKKPSQFFDLYKNNPEQIRLLVLLRDSKMVARCLLWKTENGYDFMDRIYSYDDSDVELFKMHGDAKGYWYKEQQNTSYRNRGESAYQFHISSNGKRKREEIIVKLPNPRVKFYPYLDSLIYYNRESGKLSNYRDNISATMMLCRVDGGYKDPFRRKEEE